MTLHSEVKQIQVRLDSEFSVKMRDYVPPSVSMDAWCLARDCQAMNQEWRKNHGR